MSSVKHKKCNNDLVNQKLNNNWLQNIDESSTSGVAMTSEDSASVTLTASAGLDEVVDFEALRGPSAMVNQYKRLNFNYFIYRKVLNRGRAYYSFSNTFNAPFIQGRLLYKGAYYNIILLFPSKICYFEAFLANI